MSDPFDDAAAQVMGKKQPFGETVDPFDAAASQVMDAQRTKLRTNLYQSLMENPDMVARSVNLGRKSGVPPDVVGRNLPEVERNVKLDEFDKILKDSPRLAQFMTNPQNAGISHDDTPNLATTEAGIQALRGPAPTFGSVLTGLRKSLPQGLELARQGIRMQFADLIDSPEMRADATRRYIAARFDSEITTPEFESSTAKGVYGGLSSTLRQAPGVIASVALRSTAPALATMGLQTEAEAYGKYRTRGANAADALYGAVHEGAIEVATEALPMSFLVKQFGKAGFGKFVSGLLAREIPSEQLATFAQDAVDTAVANPDKTWGQFLAERPDAAYQTLVATITQAGTMGAVNSALSAMNDRSQKAADAERNGKLLNILDGLAKSSKVRQRDPATFEEFVKQASEGGPVPNVYVNAATFAQSLQDAGVDINVVAEATPAIKEQLKDALAMGGDLSIPIEQYSASIAGTDFSQSLIPHLKTEAGGMSQLEAAAFMQSHAQELEAEVNRVLAEKQGDDAFKASRDAVVSDLREKLNAAGRFTDDVNLTKASLVGNFYAVMGARLGLTAEEMAQKYPLEVQATQPTGGTAMDQTSPEFRNWFGNSKVLDEDGNPGIVHHFTYTDFQVFDRQYAARTFKRDPEGIDTLGSWFTDNPKARYVSPEMGGKRMDVHLSIQKPFYIDDLEDGKPGGEAFNQLQAMVNEAGGSTALREKLKAQGYDGIVLSGTQLDGVRQNAIIAFDPTQIKSATGNQGTYDPNDPNILHQSVTLRTGKEKLKVPQEKSGDYFLTRDVARALEARQRKKYGTIDRKDQSDEAAQRIAKWMIDEIKFELSRPEDNALGWYSTKYQGALDMIGRQEFPELLTDKNARDMLTVIFGVTSDGADPAKNLLAAMEIYEGFRSTGKLAAVSGHNRDYTQNLKVLQDLYDSYGHEGMREYLMQQRTVKELRQIAKAAGKEVKIEYQPHITLPMAAVALGPKVGAFYANLMGAYGYLTMDRWWSRTFNRMRGQLLTHATQPGKEKVKRLLGNPDMSDPELVVAIAPIVNAYAKSGYKDKTELAVSANTVWKAFTGTEDSPWGVTDRTFMIKTVGLVQKGLSRRGIKLDIANIQALLWYYEKRLYAELGAVPSGTDSYYEVAQKALALRAAKRAGASVPAGSIPQGDGGAAQVDDGRGVVAAPEEGVPPDTGDTGNGEGPEEAPGSEFLQSGTPGSLGGVRGADEGGERGRRADSQRQGLEQGLQGPLGRHDSLADLPSTSPGSNSAILDLAAAYMRSAGLPPLRQTQYVKVNKDRATSIANAYAEMQHDPDDPDVAASYQAMIAETLAQFQAIKQLGIKFSFIKNGQDYPYPKGPIQALYDLRDNKHLWVFPTSDGFGTENEISDNPLLAMTDEYIDGKQLQANDVFRIVHDIFGHAKEGNGFGAIGEENAWQSHAIMYSPLALKAMTSETRGQNSWVNFGPHGEHNRANPKDTIYADQKVGILPDWVMEDGRSPTMPVPEATYPAQDPPDYEFSNYKELGGRMVYMTPDQYLAATKPLTIDESSQDNIDDLVSMMREGRKIDPPRLTLEGDRVTAHDGRHRAYAAKALGIERLPVLLMDMTAGSVPELSGVTGQTGGRVGFLPGKPDTLDQEARGSIRFADDITAAPSIISLLNNADLSTFLHESGHFFLQVMADMATRPGAPAEVVQDMNSLLSWFGVPDLATWNAMSTDEQRPYHESFARGFEAYLMEGKAPVPELVPLFQKFRAWMLNVYRHILELAKGNAGQAMQVQLTPEVRSVMDRMLATSETIKEAEDSQGYAPLFGTRPDGLTPEEWDIYQWLGQQATQDAIHELETRSMRDMKWASNARNAIIKRMQKDAAEQRASVRAEVAAEVAAEPINQVRTFLKDGERDGNPVPGPHKISLEALEAMYGGEGDRYALLDWKALSTMGLTAKDGVHPDELASDFGFRSGDEVVQALLKEDTAQARIEAITDQRMLERYGDLNSEANIARAADAAIHNDARIRFVATELNALNKAAGRKPLLAAAAKAFAELSISRKKVRDLKPHEYAAAGKRAARAAAQAMKDGDLQTAAVEKRNQLVNEYAAQAAHKALTEVDKKVTYLNKVGAKKAQQKMRGQGAAQLLALLDRFDLRKARSLKEIDRRQALAEWAAEEATRLSAPPPLLSQKVLDEANRTHYRNLTLEEFRGLVDSVKQLEHMARREHKAFIELRNLSIQEEVAKGVAEIREAFPEAFDKDGAPKLDTPLTNRYVPSLGKKLREGVRNIVAEFIPMEDLIDRLTAGKFGQLHDSLFGRLSNASDRKAIMAGEVRDKLKPLLDAYTFREKRDFARKEIPGTNMTRENIVMLALHYGNVEGRQRLESQGFTEARIVERLKHLTAKDIDLINGIWDLNDNFIWPQYVDLNMRTQGKAPAKVEASPVTFTTVAGGQVTLRGGYVKLVYDADFDESTRQRDSMADAMSMISGRTGANPKTDQGSSQERVAELSKMPLLELRAVAQAVNEHMHDIHFREAVADTVRLLREPAMRDAIKAVAGKAVYTELLAKVNEVAARPVEPSGAVLKGLNIARRNTVVVLMSGIKTALVNYTGLLPALTQLNAGAILKNTAKVHSHRAREMIRFAQAKSIYMRERNQAFTSDLQHQMDAMSVKNRIMPEMGTFLILMRLVDQMTSTSVWLAGYEDGMRKFKLDDGTPDEERAIEYANTITRSTQGSGRELDTSKIMTRFGPWAKMFTMFYSFFNKQAALLARQGLIAEREWTRGNRAKAVGLFTASYVAVVALPAMINEIASGRCDDALKGDEGWGRCTARGLTMNMAGYIPIVRDVAPYAWSLVDDQEPTYGLRMTSISAFFEGVAKGAAATVEVAKGDGDERDTKTIFMGLAFSFGLPGLLAWNMLSGTNAFLEGDAGPQAVLFGPPKK